MFEKSNTGIVKNLFLPSYTEAEAQTFQTMETETDSCTGTSDVELEQPRLQSGKRELQYQYHIEEPNEDVYNQESMVDTSMAVNMGLSSDERFELGMTMTTPQKDLLSPPSVTRKIPGTDVKKLGPSTLFRGRFDSIGSSGSRSAGGGRRRDYDHGDGDGDAEVNECAFKINPWLNGHVEVNAAFKIKNAQAIAGKASADIIGDDDDDGGNDTDGEKEETSSLVSEYGSDIGDVKLRLEDVNAMDALAEEGEEDDTDVTCTTPEEKENKISKHYGGLSCDIGSSYDRNSQRDDDGVDDDYESSQHGSVDSIDLASHHEGLAVEYVDSTEDAGDTIEVDSPIQRKVVVPSSPRVKTNAEDIKDIDPPTTPIGAVSAALRRFGNGVSVMQSNMTRCSKTSPPASPNYYRFEVDADLSLKDPHEDVGDVWLSPRFGNQKSAVAKASIQQPRFVKSGGGVTPMMGMASCLSFDPESGRRPYGNMRMTDSPPSSPLPTHRKTRSWGSGSGGSEFFVGNIQDISDATNTQVLDPQDRTSLTPRSRVFSAQSFPATSGFIPGRLQGILTPRRDKVGDGSPSSPRGSIRFADDRLTRSPKPKVKRTAAVLQSPQVSVSNYD